MAFARLAQRSQASNTTTVSLVGQTRARSGRQPASRLHRPSQTGSSFGQRFTLQARVFGTSAGHGHAPDPVAVFKKVSEIDKQLLSRKIDSHTANELKFQLLEKIKPEVMAVHKERSELGYTYAEDGKRIFTREEVGKHNTDTDLWVIVDDKVYNVTTWLEYHPGGMEVLRKNGGKDATQPWHGVGHSFRAREAMENYHIGYVNTPRRFSALDETEPPKKFT